MHDKNRGEQGEMIGRRISRQQWGWAESQTEGNQHFAALTCFQWISADPTKPVFQRSKVAAGPNANSSWSESCQCRSSSAPPNTKSAKRTPLMTRRRRGAASMLRRAVMVRKLWRRFVVLS